MQSQLLHGLSAPLFVPVLEFRQYLRQCLVLLSSRQVFKRLKHLQVAQVVAVAPIDDHRRFGGWRIEVAKAFDRTGAQRLAQERSGNIGMSTRNIEQSSNC